MAPPGVIGGIVVWLFPSTTPNVRGPLELVAPKASSPRQSSVQRRKSCGLSLVVNEPLSVLLEALPAATPTSTSYELTVILPILCLWTNSLGSFRAGRSGAMW